MSLADARAAIADALADTTANVYAYPPAVVMPPAILMVPGDTYVEPVTIGANGIRARQRLQLTLAVAPIDNPATLDGIENLMGEVLLALPTSIAYEGGFSRPVMSQVGPSDLLTSDLTITVVTTIEAPEPEPIPEPEP